MAWASQSEKAKSIPEYARLVVFIRSGKQVCHFFLVLKKQRASFFTKFYFS